MSAPKPAARRSWWPVGIVAAFAVFLAGTAALIVVSVTHRMDLVATDYYEQELRYQQHMDRSDRARQLPEPLRVAFDAANRAVVLMLPKPGPDAAVSGTIQLYRPAASGEDRQVELKPDASGRQSVDARELSPGLWRVRVTWSAGGQEFSAEEKIVVAAR